MNTNEQKTLGQILWEAQNNSPIPTWDNWLNSEQKEKWERLASAVEQAVLERLGPDSVHWVVNDLGELGVEVFGRFFFLYKGDSLEYKSEDGGEHVMHDGGGEPMKVRMVGKREFGEVCHPLSWVMAGRSEDRYTVNLTYHPGLSFGNPEDGDWRNLPSPHHIRRTEAKAEPLPPTTEQKPEGEAQRAFVPASSESPPQGADDLPITERVVRPLLEAIDNQIAALTKERDEARAINVQTLRDSQEQHARAEQAEKQLLSISQERDAARAAGSETAQKAAQLREENCQLAARLEEAEKKLAEVESKETGYQKTLEEHERTIKQMGTKLENFSAELLFRRNEVDALEQKLQQSEASVPRWVSTSSRLPTRHDADENSQVWAVDKEDGKLVYAFVSSAINYDLWMTPVPLPTPTDENDPARLAAVAYDSYRSKTPDGEGMSFADFKIAFLAGKASNSPLTKD